MYTGNSAHAQRATRRHSSERELQELARLVSRRPACAVVAAQQLLRLAARDSAHRRVGEGIALERAVDDADRHLPATRGEPDGQEAREHQGLAHRDGERAAELGLREELCGVVGSGEARRAPGLFDAHRYGAVGERRAVPLRV